MSTTEAPVMMEAVLAGRSNGYFANRGIILLNLNLVISLISSYATGYDGSMMSGFLSLGSKFAV
jgi:hypothetical protein